MPEMTLEQAQERILTLETELETMRTTNQTLSQNNDTLTNDLKRARELNQKMLEKVIDHKAKEDEPDEEDKPTQTLEEYAEGLKIF